jgi:hypothetical protein
MSRPERFFRDVPERDISRLEVHRYLNMEDLKEHKKDQLREAA